MRERGRGTGRDGGARWVRASGDGERRGGGAAVRPLPAPPPCAPLRSREGTGRARRGPGVPEGGIREGMAERGEDVLSNGAPPCPPPPP